MPKKAVKSPHSKATMSTRTLERPVQSSAQSEAGSRTFLMRMKQQWQKRKPFSGWGILLVYCHALMFSTAGAALKFNAHPDLTLFLSASSTLVPIAFALTTLCLFVRWLFFVPLLLGYIQALLGLTLLMKGYLFPDQTAKVVSLASCAWYATVLAGLLLLITLAWLKRCGVVHLFGK